MTAEPLGRHTRLTNSQSSPVKSGNIGTGPDAKINLSWKDLRISSGLLVIHPESDLRQNQ